MSKPIDQLALTPSSSQNPSANSKDSVDTQQSTYLKLDCDLNKSASDKTVSEEILILEGKTATFSWKVFTKNIGINLENHSNVMATQYRILVNAPKDAFLHQHITSIRYMKAGVLFFGIQLSQSDPFITTFLKIDKAEGYILNDFICYNKNTAKLQVEFVVFKAPSSIYEFKKLSYINPRPIPANPAPSMHFKNSQINRYSTIKNNDDWADPTAVLPKTFNLPEPPSHSRHYFGPDPEIPKPLDTALSIAKERAKLHNPIIMPNQKVDHDFGQEPEAPEPFEFNRASLATTTTTKEKTQLDDPIMPKQKDFLALALPSPLQPEPKPQLTLNSGAGSHLDHKHSIERIKINIDRPVTPPSEMLDDAQLAAALQNQEWNRAEISTVTRQPRVKNKAQILQQVNDVCDAISSQLCHSFAENDEFVKMVHSLRDNHIINELSRAGLTPMHHACTKKAWKEIVILEKCGADMTRSVLTIGTPQDILNRTFTKDPNTRKLYENALKQYEDCYKIKKTPGSVTYGIGTPSKKEWESTQIQTESMRSFTDFKTKMDHLTQEFDQRYLIGSVDLYQEHLKYMMANPVDVQKDMAEKRRAAREKEANERHHHATWEADADEKEFSEIKGDDKKYMKMPVSQPSPSQAATTTAAAMQKKSEEHSKTVQENSSSTANVNQSLKSEIDLFLKKSQTPENQKELRKLLERSNLNKQGLDHYIQFSATELKPGFFWKVICDFAAAQESQEPNSQSLSRPSQVLTSPSLVPTSLPQPKPQAAPLPVQPSIPDIVDFDFTDPVLLSPEIRAFDMVTKAMDDLVHRYQSAHDDFQKQMAAAYPDPEHVPADFNMSPVPSQDSLVCKERTALATKSLRERPEISLRININLDRKHTFEGSRINPNVPRPSIQSTIQMQAPINLARPPLELPKPAPLDPKPVMHPQDIEATKQAKAQAAEPAVKTATAQTKAKTDAQSKKPNMTKQVQTPRTLQRKTTRPATAPTVRKNIKPLAKPLEKKPLPSKKPTTTLKATAVSITSVLYDKHKLGHDSKVTKDKNAPMLLKKTPVVNPNSVKAAKLAEERRLQRQLDKQKQPSSAAKGTVSRPKTAPAARTGQKISKPPIKPNVKPAEKKPIGPNRTPKK